MSYGNDPAPDHVPYHGDRGEYRDPDALNLPDDGYPAPGTEDNLAGCAGLMFALMLAMVLLLVVWSFGRAL